MKTKQELENIKEEIEKLNAELHELTDDELEQVTGGVTIDEIKAELEGKAKVESGRIDVIKDEINPKDVPIAETRFDPKPSQEAGAGVTLY